jgi:molybdopterin-guanine dinucleotide biosynthesis protein MobB
MSRRIHIVGRKNSGKTTLVCELVHEFTARGLNVATVKHTHHHHELDAPGKDSHKHREAGAVAVGILSPKMTALFVPIDGEQCGDSRYAQFELQFADCELILVEGDLQASAKRIEVWRSVSGEAPYAANDSAIFAVVSDDAPQGIQCAVWSRRNLKEIADNILKSFGLQSDNIHGTTRSRPREV